MDKVSDKLIFLDVDGVLNCIHTHERSPEGFSGVEQGKVKLLADIVKRTGALIVLSSSWRDEWHETSDESGNSKMSPGEDGIYLMGCLAEEGLTLAGLTVKGRGYERGSEILAYLADHDHDSYVILDDEPFDFSEKGIAAHWCRTSVETGLTEGNVKEAVRILNAKIPDVNTKKIEKKNFFKDHFGRKL